MEIVLTVESANMVLVTIQRCCLTSVLDEITNKPDETGDGLKYPNSNGIIKINEQNYLSIYKQVKGIYDDDYLNNNQIAKTAPGEDLDYKIVI